ncbi:hypothetical protein FEM48_Zijuj04G0140900 [Ziziphus jujuba var. spinosa]|uniref:Zinc finger protein CONSTANS-LIKE 9-like n=1 Tax=Ziziphus jujuba var. spinosa TaxID=714518 RepID=A0A978VKB3_ZIZJJ|nr:hypothetical protein FEM48_Zijuj04G0140900 [Ziziphus jujuba var. spinosa]
MGYICDFCGDQRSMVYCRSDAACLCLSCDRNVHSANALSRRHSRTLLCERCNSQPALVRCSEERVSLCQNCDWMGHGNSTSASSHKRQTINCYSGCPSAAELSSIWSFVLDFPSVGESACEQEMGMMSITENSTENAWDSSENASGSARVNDVPSMDNKPSLWACSSSVPEHNSAAQVLDQPVGSASVTLPKSSIWELDLYQMHLFFPLSIVHGLCLFPIHGYSLASFNLCKGNRGSSSFLLALTPANELYKFHTFDMQLCCPGTKGPGLCEDDDLYEDFNMDEMDLNLENYEELFGMALNNSEELLENGGIDSLFGTKDMSGADSNCQGAVAAESNDGLDYDDNLARPPSLLNCLHSKGPHKGSSVGLVNAMQPACSNAASADSVMSTKTEPILCFNTKQAHSNLSFSGLTGESSAGDYQDCGASSMLLMGEPPWCPPPCQENLQSASRSDAVMRYKEKKKTRKFEKRVRYASRKARADVRKRVKGRFVKAGDAYDYDPLNQTRSC